MSAPGDDWDPAFEQRSAAFAPLFRAMSPFRAHRDWPTLDDWNAALPAGLLSAGGAPIKFVRQPPKRNKRNALPYDERIFTLGEVPSRSRNWHDFFNMLVWRTFPATKRAINARQRAALRPGAPTRTPEQDALAMLDEGGAVLLSRIHVDTAAALAGDVDGVASLVRRGEARVIILGHAIYEHLVVGGAVVRAFVQVVATDAALTAEIADEALASALERAPIVYDRSRVALPVVDALFDGR